MIYNDISEFYCFGSQAESREVLYWSIRYPRSIFLQTKTPEMNVSESVHESRKKFYWNRTKILEDLSKIRKWKKKCIFFPLCDSTGQSTFIKTVREGLEDVCDNRCLYSLFHSFHSWLNMSFWAHCAGGRLWRWTIWSVSKISKISWTKFQDKHLIPG